MKKSVVIKANKIIPDFKLTFDYKSAVFFSVMVFGLIIGVHLVDNGNNKWHELLKGVIENFLLAKAQNGIFMNFSVSFLPWFIIILFVYICGMCGLGSVFVSFSPVIIGVYYGVSVTSYYLNFGAQGILYCLLINLPLYAIAAATLIKGCCESVKISKNVLFYLISGKGEGKPLIKDYTVKFLFYLIPLISGSVMSALLYNWFSKLFSFIT